jgi:hypothetical protein
MASRTIALLIAAVPALLAWHTSPALAQWWSRSPRDYEECAEAAEKAAAKEERGAALANCNAKFAGRRKPGGGYTYYDFMQDRSFDIAGPNPTAEEQKSIDEQYATYLEKQRRAEIAAAFALKQQEQQQQRAQPATFRSETEKVPLPHQRPKQLGSAAEIRQRAKDCAKNSFSCDWPHLSEGWNELKKLFSPSPAKAKKG